MRSFFLLIFLFLSLTLLSQQPVIRFAGQPEQPLSLYQIVVSDRATDSEKKAGMELQKYLQRISGLLIPILGEQVKMRPCEFVLGKNLRYTSMVDSSHTGPDGFKIRTKGTSLFIYGDRKGTLYGVYEFLERVLGCRFLAPDAEVIPNSKSLTIPALDIKSEPAFGSRETYYAEMADPDFADKMRCNIHAWKMKGDWGLWVHTLFSLVPPEQYFNDHPEYYALMGGQRSKTQLCLTNPDVLKIVTEELGKRIKENPNAKYWSVSQMDTYGYCECEKCKAIYSREGSPSGAYLEFVNKVAAFFPDKIISTLAYQFTRKAPLHIKPASNVNIMLCTIECDRSLPLEADTSAGSFANDLRNWSAISGNIMVWDYVIQFTNMIAPFPNLAVLQPNIRMFKNLGVTAVFEQGCHTTYSENQELRAYLLAKLLWNPFLNLDSLATGFLEGYYGNASPWIGKYLGEMEQNLSASGKNLWIYGSPVEEGSSFLGSDQLKSYARYFDLAEKAVEPDPVLLARVYKARLPLQYAEIEIARKNITGPDGFLEENNKKWQLKPTFTSLADTFVVRARWFNVASIHERGLSPDRYRKIIDSCGKTAFIPHLALGKPYVLTNEPAKQYMADGPGTLTDGKRGFDNYHFLWQGFEGEDFEMVIDLGKVQPVSYFSAGFLRDITSWIFFPESVEYSCSTDGKVYKPVKLLKNEDNSRDPVAKVQAFSVKVPVLKARYIRVFAKSVRTCPDWHIGHGGKAWLFVDEVVLE